MMYIFKYYYSIITIMTNCKSLYKTHEKQFNEKILYPMNSLSSLFYLIPIMFISDLFGKFILFGMVVSSTLWWAKQTKTSHYFDLLFLSSTLIWSLSYITQINSLNYFIVPIIFIRNNTYKNIVIVSSVSLILINTNYISKCIFFLSVVSKISDTFFGNQYGTAIFHILSSISICFI